MTRYKGSYMENGKRIFFTYLNQDGEIYDEKEISEEEYYRNQG